MATLTGKLVDVTSRSPDTVSTVTVKAPTVRVGSGTGIITTSPATINFNHTTGDITITNITGGLSWLYLEGDGWSDSIPLAVAEGMTTLVEAFANAAGAPGMVDFMRLLEDFRVRVNQIAQDAVDDLMDWDKGVIPASTASIDDLAPGTWGVANGTVAQNLGLPALGGTLEIRRIVSGKTATMVTQELYAQELSMWIASSSSDTWSTWKKVYPNSGYLGELPDGADADVYHTVGSWGVRSNRSISGLPAEAAGSLEILTSGGRTIQRFTTWEPTPRVFIRGARDTASTWYSWKQLGSDGSGDSGEPTAISGGAAGLKTVGMALTAGSLLNGVAGRYRVLTQVTAPVVRWRIHVESHRMLSNTTSAFTLGAVYVGNHSGNGAMTGQRQIKSGSLSVPADGEWVSPWLDADLLANETLIDLNVSGSDLYWSQATSWVYEGGSWVSSKNSPVSIWVELETYDQVPVVGMIGDSTGAGQGAGRPVFDSALYIAARKNKFIPMAYTYPGSSMQSINDYSFHLFQRWAHLDKPDSVIIQSGSNDIHAGTATAELQTRFADLVETAQMISPVVIGSTVKARYPNSGGHQTALNAHNSFVKTRANGNRDYLDFYQAVSPSGTVASADAADAAHLSTSGHQKLATAFDSVTVSRPAWIDASSGTGSPEGKVSAPIGSTYTDPAATNGAIRWVKTSGTGNTGWRVECGDTGWRDITADLSLPVLEGQVTIRRTTSMAYIYFYDLKVEHPGTELNDGPYIDFGNILPAGFYDPDIRWLYPGTLTSRGSGYSSGSIRVSRYGDMRVSNVLPGEYMTGFVSLTVSNRWPNSLPGTPL